jgi:hypothetical protein
VRIPARQGTPRSALTLSRSTLTNAKESKIFVGNQHLSKILSETSVVPDVSV